MVSVGQPRATKQLFGNIIGLIAAGKLAAPVHGTYAVKDIKKAVAEAAGSGRNGKVIVVGDSLL